MSEHDDFPPSPKECEKHYLKRIPVGVLCVAGRTEPAEALAQRFHETYERLAPQFGYDTREASRTPWTDVPEKNRKLMIAVCAELLSASLLGRTEPADASLIEALAEWDHRAWSGWMRHVFGRCRYPNPRGVVMPAEDAERWMRQMNTDYADLSEAEKESDRKEARQILDVLKSAALLGAPAPQRTTTDEEDPSRGPSVPGIGHGDLPHRNEGDD